MLLKVVKSGVSEVVGALLILLITTSLMVIIYITFSSNIISSITNLQKELTTLNIISYEYAEIVFVNINTTSRVVDVYVATGSLPVTIYAVYANGILILNESKTLPLFTNTRARSSLRSRRPSRSTNSTSIFSASS